MGDDMLRSRNLVVLGAAGSLVLLVAVYLSVAAVAPGNAAFQARWERTDEPVLSGQVSRTWIWGPEANTNCPHRSLCRCSRRHASGAVL